MNVKMNKICVHKWRQISDDNLSMKTFFHFYWNTISEKWIFGIILCFLIFLVFLIFHFWRNEEYLGNSYPPKGRGYCDIDTEYIMPVVYDDFITKDEANAILEKATPKFRDSLIVSGSDSNVRKSQTAWLERDDPVIKNIVERVCKITNMPFNNSEQIQVVKYEPNGYYKEHYDASCDDRIECVEFEKNGGQRMITMLLCLDDNYEGGETHFPRLNKKYKLPKCGGLLFYSLENKPNGKCHPKSLHAGLPVESGTKYIANIWIREREIV